MTSPAALAGVLEELACCGVDAPRMGLPGRLRLEDGVNVVQGGVHGRGEGDEVVEGPVVATVGRALIAARPFREAIRRAISGNYCRCTGYHAIVDAIQTAARENLQQGEEA